MGRSHFVRVGTMGDVGRFVAAEATIYPRRTRVVLRTRRGLELGEVLAPPDDESDLPTTDGTILRGMTIEDQLLEVRLEKNRQRALSACAVRLADDEHSTTLLDVEQLFDGRTLVFHFLGEVTPLVESLTSELAELYESQAQIGRFAETLTHGCGPGCGTAEAAGGACDSCGVGCAIAGACSPRSV